MARDTIINISLMLEEYQEDQSMPLFTLAIEKNVFFAVKADDFTMFNNVVQTAASEMLDIQSLLSAKSA